MSKGTARDPERLSGVGKHVYHAVALALRLEHLHELGIWEDE